MEEDPQSITAVGNNANKENLTEDAIKRYQEKSPTLKKPENKNNTINIIQRFSITDEVQSNENILDNLDTLCRVCLSQEEVTSLHKNKDYPTFVFLLRACHKSGIPVNNIYPSNICNLCSSKLKNISYFIKKLKDTTEKLNSFFDREFEVTEDENKEIEQSKNVVISGDTDDDEEDCTEIEDNVEETIIIEEDIDEDIQEQSTDDIEDSPKVGKSLRCDPCNRTFNYFTSWQCHMIRHEEINKYKCQHCDWISIDEQKYQEHLKTTHNDLVMTNSKMRRKAIIYKEDSDTKQPKKFVSLTIEGKFKCNVCEMTFKGSSDLDKHITSHEDHNGVQCEVCGKTYVSDFALRLHLETAHENKNFNRADVKLKKRKRHQPKEKLGEYNCELCNKHFVSKSSLNRHIQISHEQNKRFCCDVCGEKFTVKNSLKYHLNIHTDSKPFACNMCSKSFRQPAALFRHQKTKHNDEKKFHCEICLKMFKTGKGLENHGLKHATLLT